MKALVYLGPRRMQLQDAPEPAPGAGEVVIRTGAAAICGSDLHGFREASPRRIPPLVMGHEAVGTVAAVGDGVDPARVDERVVLKPILACGVCERCRDGRTNLCTSGRLVGRDLTGAFAERFAIPASAAVPVADHVADDLATLTEPLANAVHVASRAVGTGDNVLVIGAGPIGALMVRMARRHGASQVFATDPVATRLAIAEAQGATPLRPEDPEASLHELTDGRGVDVVIDAAGFDATWALALRAVRSGGRVEAVGLAAPEARINFFAVADKEVVVTASYAWIDEDFARALRLIEDGAIDASGWFTRMPLSDGQRAFEELVDSTEHFKVVLTP
jgi:2-desacetyl-2-hydroxyethyl bacteriochlorophyllide A dehydrogenase